MKWERSFEVSARDLVEFGVLAPSSHNTQPWIFHVTSEGLELIADRTRSLPVNDPDDRELVISCGAALFNLRVGAEAHELECEVATLPDRERPDLLASVRLTPGDARSAPLQGLARAVSQRRTYRRDFSGRTIGDAETREFQAAAEAQGCLLTTVTDPDVQVRVARLVSEGDSRLWASREWRRELAAWMRPRGSGDGLVVPRLAAPVVRMVVRTFNVGRIVAAKDSALVDAAPVLVVLGTESDRETDWIAAGQALERVLLTATSQGLQASYLNQPVQVPALRSELADEVSLRFPQVVLRLGYPEAEVEPAPRRSVDAVLRRSRPAEGPAIVPAGSAEQEG